MSEPLYTLSYFSRNAIDHRQVGELKNNIDEILETARRINVRRGITGALLYSAGYFAQVLEGPLSQVEDTFERIQLDDRHCDVKVLHFHRLRERSFGAWSMAFAGLEQKASACDGTDADLADTASLPGDPGTPDFTNVLRDLIGRHEVHGV